MKIIFIFLLAITLSSCGLFKSTFKRKEVHSEVSKTEVKSNNDSTGKKIDKSTIQSITTKTSVTELPSKKIRSSLKVNKKQLQNGVKAIDSAGVEVIVSLDSASNLLRVMANVAGEKKTETETKITNRQNDINEQSNTNKQKEEKKQVAVENITKTVQKEPKKMFWLWASIVGGIAVLCYFLFRRFRK